LSQFLSKKSKKISYEVDISADVAAGLPIAQPPIAALRSVAKRLQGPVIYLLM
jgi:hypothetical protein